MSICKKCGASMPSNENFCPYCGAAVNDRTGTDNSTSHNSNSSGVPSNNNAWQYNKVPYNAPYGSPQPGGGYPMTTGGWVGRLFALGLLVCVPFVGWIIEIIMLCVWMGDQSKDATYRNWAKAQLIIYLIFFVLTLIPLFIIVVPILSEL